MNLVTLRIIWAALLGSHFLYGFALYVLINQNTVPPEEVSPMMLPILSSLAIIIFFAAIFLPRFFLASAKKLMQPKLNLEDLIPQFVAPFVVRLALFEAMALFGFGLAFLHKDIKYFLPFAAVSVVAYFLNFPTEVKIKDAFN